MSAHEPAAEGDSRPGAPSSTFEVRPEPENVTGRRVVAALLDLVPLTVLAVGMATRAGTVDQAAGYSIRLEGWAFVLFVVAVVSYFVVSEGLTGTSPGKWLLGLEVERLDGVPMGWGAVVGRNALRLLDGLPILYLVGIVTIWSTETNQRVGDLAAGTVVRRRTAAPPASHRVPGMPPPDEQASAASRGRSGRDIAVRASLVAALMAIGVTLTVAGPPPPSVGDLSVEDDVDAFVLETVDAVFRPLSQEAFAERTMPELAATSRFDESMSLLADNPGPIVGPVTILDSRVEDRDIPGVGTLPAVEYLIEAEFRDGRSTLQLIIVNRGGQLQIAAWHVTFV